MDSIETFIEKFTEAVDFQEPVPLTAETDLRDLPEWDSLAALGVIVMCDMEYSKTITGNDLVGCVVLNDIYKLVS